MILEYLYSTEKLYDLDSDIDSLIFVSDEEISNLIQKVYNNSNLSAFETNKLKEFNDFFVTKLDKNLKTGDVVLVANDEFTKKAYCLITIICGRIVPYVLFYTDLDKGIESINNFSKADVDMLMTYPMLSSDEEIVFFLTKLSFIFNVSASSDYSKYVPTIKSFLDKGLWCFTIEQEKIGELGGQYIGVGITTIFNDTLKKLGYEEKGNDVYQKDGLVITTKTNEENIRVICGAYDSIKNIYCDIANTYTDGMLIYTDNFGAMFNYLKGIEVANSNLQQYEESVKKVFEVAPIVKTEQEVENQILQNKDEKIELQENTFLAEMDKLFEETENKEKDKKEKNNIDSFSKKEQISDDEKNLAIKESMSNMVVPKVKLPNQNAYQKNLNKDAKNSQAILNSPSPSMDKYPQDWDYVYTVGETSKMYNPTYGQRYDANTNSFYQDDKQNKGMTIDEWNAYFISHPELGHLVDETIGHIGGITKTKDELIKSGELLYDVNSLRFVYKYEFLKGNIYKLIDEFKAREDVIAQRFGRELFDNQLEVLNLAKPTPRKLLDSDPSKVPYIHPLDDIVIGYTLNSISGIVYENGMNKDLMFKERMRLKDEIDNKKLQSSEFNSRLIEYSKKYQSLPITTFFIDWIKTQVGRIAEYGLSDIDFVFHLYFSQNSHKSYADLLVEKGLIKLPSNSKSTDVISISDYFDAKDSAKRFVNDLFQEFIKTQLNESDREQIEYLWNKKYNGYYLFDEEKIWKLPVFIRHSKYFKNRSYKRLLQLNETQIKGVKFATIENSSIMAHEVGYGKTLVAIGYISHCFETNQANNFLVTIPKALFSNKKWKEEIYGLYDSKIDKYIIGATPNYNLIEIGNFSTTDIYGGGKKSQLKTYSDDDVQKINEIDKVMIEIAINEKYKKTASATIPTNPFNFKHTLVNSIYAWSKIFDKILPTIDPILFDRCKGKDYDKYKKLIDFLASYNFSTNTTDKTKEMIMLMYHLIIVNWYFDEHIALFGDTTVKLDDINKSIFGFTSIYDDRTKIKYNQYEYSQKGELYKKDANGKYIIDKKTNDKVLRPEVDVAKDYVMDTLIEIHKYIGIVCQRMKDFAIYEYGQWKFSTSQKNIVLATKDALENLGFSSSNIESIKEVIKEITTYNNEERLDLKGEATLTVVNNVTGISETFKRKPEKVLQKQLQELLNKIEVNLTEQGDSGKFFLENLKIDGFILDEAHLAKKLFTNVKTDSGVYITFPTGDKKRINTTSHDIKGGGAPDISLAVFGICQYIRSIGDKKPLMLLTATPFSNQPTEIFSMLSLVGIRQLRENGISNIKNFFDLFLKESLKYDFNQNGEFIKRISVEDFRNKDMLMNLIWSVIDIRREASLDKKQILEKKFGDKPSKEVLPILVSDFSAKTVEVKNEGEKEEDIAINECEALGKVSTIAVLNRLSINTCSIVDQNDVQKKMFADIEKVIMKEINPNTNLEYTFDDISPNVAIIQEFSEKTRAKSKDGKSKKVKGKEKSAEDEEKDYVIATLRTLINSNVNSIGKGFNLKDANEFNSFLASKDFTDAKDDTYIFVKNDNNNKWSLYKKTARKQSNGNYYQKVSDEETAVETIKKLTKNIDFGNTFKALGISRAISLSPYFNPNNQLPYPTPENLIKYSPKIEFLVKALKSVKDHHVKEIPKLIEANKKSLEDLKTIKNPTTDDINEMVKLNKTLTQLESALEISGQVIYTNMMRFKYVYRDKNNEAKVDEFLITDLITDYLVGKGWFTEDEVKTVSSDTSEKNKENYIKDFQDGKIKVLFGTPAIKEGVDLQNKASTMYILTPDWNPTDMRQVEGRIWRRDNENKYVRIVYILLDQSIEVFIYSKLEEKANRLQKIMRERGSIEEFAEMSLDANETKVALASDPEKRAKIITELCNAVLSDQLKKISRDVKEFGDIVNNIDVVSQNIEIVKNDYLAPFFLEMPKINKIVAEAKSEPIAKLYERYKEAKNSIPTTPDEKIRFDVAKERFVNDFIYSLTYYGTKVLNLANLSPKCPTNNLNSSDSMMYYFAEHTRDYAFVCGASLQRAIANSFNLEYNMTYSFQDVAGLKMEDVFYIIHGLKICIDNRVDFLQKMKDGENSLNLINSKLKRKVSDDWVDTFFYSDNNMYSILYRLLQGTKGVGGYGRFINADGIFYLLQTDSDELIVELDKVLTTIISKMPTIDNVNISKNEILDLLRNYAYYAAEKLINYSFNHPFIDLKNHLGYKYYTKQINDNDKKIKDNELSIANNLPIDDILKFDSMDIQRQIIEIVDMTNIIDSNYDSFNRLESKSKLNIIKEKYQSVNEIELSILTKLNIIAEDKVQTTVLRSQFIDLVMPITRMNYSFKNAAVGLKNRGATLNDLPNLLNKSQEEYNSILKKLDSLKVSKIKLIERFEKINKEREKISLDDIIAKFTETNYRLNYKLPRVN